MDKNQKLKIELEDGELSIHLDGKFSIDDMCLISANFVLELLENMIDNSVENGLKSSGFEKIVLGIAGLPPELRTAPLAVAYERFQTHLCAAILAKYEGVNMDPMYRAAITNFGSVTTLFGECANVEKKDIALNMLEVAKGVLKIGKEEKKDA